MLRLGSHDKFTPFGELTFTNNTLPKINKTIIQVSDDVPLSLTGSALQSLKGISYAIIELLWDDIDTTILYNIWDMYMKSLKQDHYISIIMNDNLISYQASDNWAFSNDKYNPNNRDTINFASFVPSVGILSYNGVYRTDTSSSVGLYATHNYLFDLNMMNDYPFSSFDETTFDIDALDNITISFIGYGYGPAPSGIVDNSYGCHLYVWNNKLAKWDNIGINFANPDNISTHGLIVKTIKKNDLSNYIVVEGNDTYLYVQARSKYATSSAQNSSIRTDYVAAVGNQYLCKFNSDFKFADNNFAANIPIMNKNLDISLIEATDGI